MSNSVAKFAKRFLQLPFANKSYKCGPDRLLKSNPEYFIETKPELHKYYTSHQIPLYSPTAFNGMRNAGKLAANTLRHLHDIVEPGISTYDIHEITKQYIENNGGIASSIGYKGFPGSICTSNNSIACHGVPRKDEILCEGDIISLDVTCLIDGFYGDTCYTYYVGDYNKMDYKLALFLYATKQCRDEAIKICQPLTDINRIGITIENYLIQFNRKMSDLFGVNKYNDRYEVLREFTGHGIGTQIHQSPEIIHFGLSNNKKEGIIMNEGLIFTIEPIILYNPPVNKRSDGRRAFVDADDNWTVTVPDVLSAQFEHCVGITNNGCEIFTVPDEPYPDVWINVLKNKMETDKLN
eukprot:301612_1